METNMSDQRSIKINGILEQRKPLVEKIANVQQRLQELSSGLHLLEQQRRHLLELNSAEIIGPLKDLDFLQLRLKIDDEVKELSKLRNRFARETLNIGVVGRARQGKSRLLQSISGLDATAIPDGNRQHCTGVRSTIYHNPGIEPYGEVHFHSERSFLEEVIAPYYQELQLGLPPYQLDQFMKNPLPSLLDDIGRHAEPKAKYEHLRRYREYLDQYRQLLQSIGPIKIPITEVRKYVAQDTPNGERLYHNYLAVRDVKIVCAFPHEDVGQIALIDMPGLGDTGIGDQQRLIETLGKEVDIVLFVRMPRATGDHWAEVDLQLYDLAYTALPDLPIEEWSYMILNRTTGHSVNGDNHVNCLDLLKALSENHIAIIEPIIVDCSEPEQVNRALLSNIITYLTSNIQRLDRRYVSARQEEILTLHKGVENELRKAKNALSNITTDASEFHVFGELFRRIWEDLADSLERLVSRLKGEWNTGSILLEESLNNVIEECHKIKLPSLEEVERRRNVTGGYETTYESYLHEIRTNISSRFTELDRPLKRSIDDVKIEVYNVLASYGKLDRKVSVPIEEAFSNLASEIPAQYTRLHRAFQILANFQLSYRGFLQYKVRGCLEQLTPDSSERFRLGNQTTGTQIAQVLQVIHAETLYGITEAFTDWISDPDKVAFAIVEEFVDQTLRSDKIMDEWAALYYEIRSDIWPDEFHKLGEQSQLRRQWEQSIRQLEGLNSLNSLNFLR